MNRELNFDKYTKLRKQFQTLSFEDFEYHINGEILTVNFLFCLDGKTKFRPKSIFYFNDALKNPKTDALEALLFNIGMVELISYWKAACPQHVIIKPYTLDEWQIAWWKKLWFNGLGEFFWLNSIPATQEDFLTVTCESGRHFNEIDQFSGKNGMIVPIGGGKDSVVSLEFLRSAGVEMYPMMVNPRDAMTQTVEVGKIHRNNTFVVEREIDPQLLKLNAEGYLNGHTPFSSLLAFQSLMVSYVSGITDIALSNESSANEATVPGTNINHQYSKSLEFENDFRTYVERYISKEMNYFSVLRPLSELQIAYIFSHFEQYFTTFRSCNAGSKQNIWCGQCPKCLFTAIILLPFTGPDKLKQIFGYDIFDNQDLLPVFRQLTGMDDVKPFECVGTSHEINLALNYSCEFHFQNRQLPFLLSFFAGSENSRALKMSDFIESLKRDFDPAHNLTHELYAQLRGFIRNI